MMIKYQELFANAPKSHFESEFDVTYVRFM